MKRNVATYSQFINEARTKEWIDDIEDKDGKLHNVRSDDTTKIKVLEFIYESGDDGRRYTDIVRFIVEDIGGDTYHHTTHRGYWATNLTGGRGFYSSGQEVGLLHRYCDKNDDGKWVLTNKQLISYFDSMNLPDVDDDVRDAFRDLY